uniref:Acid phosphatase/vanadium-dependent haloperoxidas proteine-related n=1 Tax=Tanacetum cinerariifolium TaxID=118510 RepID=A0A699HWG8_TANCI|nr:acid phosphatase/vanadium-dependent haloperoxidas proteine-related [Tanacetum cinerariifolium]
MPLRFSQYVFRDILMNRPNYENSIEEKNFFSWYRSFAITLGEAIYPYICASGETKKQQAYHHTYTSQTCRPRGQGRTDEASGRGTQEYITPSLIRVASFYDGINKFSQVSKKNNEDKVDWDNMIDRYKEHRWDIEQLIRSGGMPPSHFTIVTAFAVAVGLHDGLGGSTFATALILACIAMYDATSEGLHAGRQAEVLKQIVFELPVEHPLAERRPLRELLGHTPPRVCFNSGSKRMMLLEDCCRYSSSEIEPREIIPIPVV